MCPACIASAALMIGNVLSTGGLTALIVKIFRRRRVRKLSVGRTLRKGDKDHGYSDSQK